MPGKAVEPLTWRAYVLLGGLWFLSQQGLAWGGIEAEAPYYWVSTAFIALFAAACTINGRRCNALHCQISGPGYLLVAVASALSALQMIDLGIWALFAAFVAVAAVSFAIEWWVESRRKPGPNG